MWRITLKGVAAHKVRYGLTALAVLIGVAFMAGTLVLTDTIGRTFDGLFVDIYHSTDAVVRAKQPFSPGVSFSNQRSLIDASLVRRVEQVPGVNEVRVAIEGYAQLVGRDGKAIGNPGAGAPTLGEAWNDVTALNPYRLLPGGHPPRTATQVVIDKHSADLGKIRVGDQVTVLSKLPPARYTVTGIVTWGSADSPLGASITLFAPATAARVLAEPGKVSQIDVSATRGTSQEVLVRRIADALDNPRLEVLTGRQITAEGQATVRQALGFFNTFLLVFAAIALFVGSFLIFNTFSIVVAQRHREIGLLRAVGASRRQVLASVLGESAVVGVLASAAGLATGIGLAYGLKAGLAALGIDIPATGLDVATRTVVVALCFGTGVTLLAAALPARRAAATAPLAALGNVAAEADERRAGRLAGGALVLGAGVLALGLGLFTSVATRVAWVGAGAAAVFLGVAALGPLVARPLAAVLGAPLARTSVTGRLGRENAMRSPKRTSATAAALMVGVALVSLMTVVASSIKGSVNAVIDSTMRADFVISAGATANTAVGFSPTLASRLGRLPEIGAATGLRAGIARIYGTTTNVLATDPAHVGDLFDVGVSAGSLASIGSHAIAVSQRTATDHHLRIGSTLPVTFPTTGRQVFTVKAIYRARNLAGDYVFPLAAAVANFPQQLDFQIYLKLAPGVSAAAGRAAVERILAAYPTANLLDQAQFKAQQAAQVDQLLNLVYSLLGLALVIALIGIANTLALSLHERTHELGLLRAVGMTRGQLRATVRAEALVIALIGAVEGLVLGVLLGWAIVAALHDQGVTHLVVPAVQLIVVALIASLAGIAAALRPARRAARLDVLRAIATE